MSSFELEEPWGQLISINLAGEERVPIVGREFTIGRGKNSDLVVENKCVSSLHCTLFRSEDSGEVWIKDLSTNGTLVGSRVLHREQKQKLQNGDLIKLVHRKEQPDQDVTYRFVDLIHVTSEDSTLEMTQEYTETESSNGGVKRVSESGDSPPPKRRAEVGVDNGDRAVSECGEESKVLADDGPSKPVLSEESPEPLTKAALSEDDRSKPAVSEEPLKPVISEGSTKPVPFEEPAKPLVSEEPPTPALVKRDSMEESLLCGICQEILHDCVSLQPCMHSYCAGCYSDWMAMSNKCPACRNTVERISKNHIVNNLVMAYLKANPEKKRPEDCLKELDEKNKITKDMLYPKHTRSRADSDEGEGSDERGSEDDSDESVEGFHPPPFMFHTTTLTPFSLFMPPPPTRCRQCPGYGKPFIGSAHPTPPTYTCPIGGNHILCSCCTQPMPDRRAEPVCPRPQKCDLCGSAFCHMYWGCRKLGCRGCLNYFKDIDFDDSGLTDLINGNLYESKILKDYLSGKGLSIKDLLRVCCTRLADGTYSTTDSRLQPETHTCYRCAFKALQELAYLYRRDIPTDELPRTVTSRPSCYWGKMCRTQKSKPQHAENFNHICEQTRHL